MGTRAMISFDGKPTIATHWGGDPDCLGQHLLACRDMTEILAVANKHVVDAIDPAFPGAKPDSYSIADYGDWAEYQYDVRTKGEKFKVYVSKLDGWWNPATPRRYKPLLETGKGSKLEDYGND